MNYLHPPAKNLLTEEKQKAVQDFTETKLQFEGNVSGVGFSFQDDKIGGFGFAIKERIMWDSFLNEQSADILFNGYNSDYFDTQWILKPVILSGSVLILNM